MRSFEPYRTLSPIPPQAQQNPYERLLQSVSPKLRERLCAEGHSRKVGVGEVVSAMGEPCIGYVERGWLKLVRFTELGDEQLLSIRQRGSFFGLENLSYTHTLAPEVVAIAPAQVRMWSFESVQQLVGEDLELTRCILSLLIDQIEDENNLRLLNQSTKVPTRLARMLYLYAQEEGKPTASGVFLRMPFTQYDLALMLGVRRETVNVSLMELEESGLIRRSGREVWLDEKRVLTHLEHEGAIYGLPDPAEKLLETPLSRSNFSLS
jgi:CRP/FNR family transcriptional regulator